MKVNEEPNCAAAAGVTLSLDGIIERAGDHAN